MINDHPTCQVCRIGGDHDEGEEPPHAGHHPGGDCPAISMSFSLWWFRNWQGQTQLVIVIVEIFINCLFPLKGKVELNEKYHFRAQRWGQTYLGEISLPWLTWERYHCPDLLGRDITALLHEGANSEPHGVTERELVDQHLRLVIAGVRVVPLVRTESETGIRS